MFLRRLAQQSSTRQVLKVVQEEGKKIVERAKESVKKVETIEYNHKLTEAERETIAIHSDDHFHPSYRQSK